MNYVRMLIQHATTKMCVTATTEVLRPRRPSRAGCPWFLELGLTGPPAMSPYDLRVSLEESYAMPREAEVCLKNWRSALSI